MQEIVDELKTKLDSTILQKHRIKKDRDETRARLIQVTAELKEKNKLFEERENKGRCSIFDEKELIDLILNDLKKPGGIAEESSQGFTEDSPDFKEDPDHASTNLKNDRKVESDQGKNNNL